MPLYWLVYRHNKQISVIIKQGLMLLLLLLLLLLLIAIPSLAEPIDPSDIRVIDGDTIRVYHQQPQRPPRARTHKSRPLTFAANVR